MTTKQEIQLFESKKVRTVWDSETEQWYFSVVDVVEVLTDSINPTDYLKKMRKRDPELGIYIGTNCPQVAMITSSGKKRKTLAATTEQLFRLIQSIPSPKAEPFKIWMAQVASQRLDQMQDPELSIDQAIVDYKRLGYSDKWINSRIKGIEVRKELTDEWERAGYGQQLLKQLSVALTEEFGKGFSVGTLYYMRQFYITFPEIFATPWRILTWSHYKRIMQVSSEAARNWYLKEASEEYLLC